MKFTFKLNIYKNKDNEVLNLVKHHSNVFMFLGEINEDIKLQLFDFLNNWEGRSNYKLSCKIELISTQKLPGVAYQYYWEPKEYGIVARNMDDSCWEGLKKDLVTDKIWQEINFFECINLDIFKESFKTESETVPKVVIVGIYCRGCNEFNKYAEPDNVVSDDKYTCWNCANSYCRRIKDLNLSDSNYDKQILTIKALNKIR